MEGVTKTVFSMIADCTPSLDPAHGLDWISIGLDTPDGCMSAGVCYRDRESKSISASLNLTVELPEKIDLCELHRAVSLLGTAILKKGIELQKFKATVTLSGDESLVAEILLEPVERTTGNEIVGDF